MRRIEVVERCRPLAVAGDDEARASALAGHQHRVDVEVAGTVGRATVLAQLQPRIGGAVLGDLAGNLGIVGTSDLRHAGGSLGDRWGGD